MDRSQRLTLLETCAGYGGLGLGLRRVFPNLRTIAYVEIEAYACANLVCKMEQGDLDAAPIWTNLTTFPSKQFHGVVDIYAAGYPCQPFSVSGKRRGQEDPRHLWPHIQRAVAVIRPRLCFFENVPGHLTLGFKDVCHDLTELGYRVTAGLFSAIECGLPHRRQRLFALAYADGVGFERGCGKISDLKALSNSWAPSQTNIPASVERSYLWPDCDLLRTTHGAVHWVDAVRLAGNGVVPVVAERAFRTLARELSLLDEVSS